MWRIARGLLVEAVVILKHREFRKSHHMAHVVCRGGLIPCEAR